MNWILNSIGIKELMWGRPASVVVITAAFAAVAVLTVFLYRRQMGLPNRVRFGLALARLVVLIIIVAALFEPTAVIERNDKVKRRLPVLIDVSSSMSIKDQRKRPSDVVEAAVALGLLPASATNDVNKSVMSLDSKQRGLR